jgi:hypothetical protein
MTAFLLIHKIQFRPATFQAGFGISNKTFLAVILNWFTKLTVWFQNLLGGICMFLRCNLLAQSP